MNFKGAIFDLDGTLIDSVWVWEKIDHDFLGDRGLCVPPDYPEKIAHMGFEASAKYTIERFGFEESVEQIMDIWTKMSEKEYRENVMIKPYVREYLDYLKRNNVKMAVATASFEGLFMPCLERNGIAKYFDAIVTVGQTGKGKDCPDVYILAAKKLGLKPCECVVFEDLPTGIITAKSAGFMTAFVPDDFTKVLRKTHEREADYIVDSYKTLIDKQFTV